MWFSNGIVNELKKSFVEWFGYFEKRLNTTNERLLKLEQGMKKMSEVVERLTADVKKLQDVAQRTADSLVAAKTDIADLKAKLADLSDDPAELIALAESVEATLATIAAELPEPTPAV